MEPRLNVITLAVDDLDRALAFYRDGLGLHTNGVVATDLVDEKTGAVGAIVIIKLDGGLMLTLYPRSELAKDAAVPAGPPKSGEFSLGQLVASSADVDRILEQAAAAGASVTPPHDRPWGSTPATSETSTDTSGRSSGTRVAHPAQPDATVTEARAA
jgi:uncharacterized protein